MIAVISAARSQGIPYGIDALPRFRASAPAQKLDRRARPGYKGPNPIPIRPTEETSQSWRANLSITCRV